MSVAEEIEAMLHARCDALVRRDLDEALRHCTCDYELILGDAPPLVGREAVKKMYESIYAEAAFGLSYKVEDLRFDGALAAVLMREWMTLQPHRGTQIEYFALRRLGVLQRVDGAWVFVRSMVHLQAMAAI